jgi:hypothetical protein
MFRHNKIGHATNRKIPLIAEQEENNVKSRPALPAGPFPYHCAVMNIRGGYVFMKQKLLVNGRIENVFDAYYHAHLDWGNIPRPGRNVCCSLTFNF